MKKLNFKKNRIYFIDFGGVTMIVRYDEKVMTGYSYSTGLHFWREFVSYKRNLYFVGHTVKSYRRATLKEMFALVWTNIKWKWVFSKTDHPYVPQKHKEWVKKLV